MPKIFISYRRADSNDIAERIYDNLANAFGEDHVFKDQYSIKPGEDFRDAIRREVGTVDVLLVLIGPDWLTVSQSLANGTVVRRIDHPDDWVRREVEVGIERLTDANTDDDVQVIPILVRGASMPSRDELPESIRHLAFLQGYRVRSDSDFRRDIGILINHLRGENAPKPVTPSQPEGHLAALQNWDTRPSPSSPPAAPPSSLIRRLRLNEPWAIILAALITVGFPFLVSQINNQQNMGAATPTIPVTPIAADRSTDIPLPPTSTDTPLPPTATATQIMLQRTADAKVATNEALFAESTSIAETAKVPTIAPTTIVFLTSVTLVPIASETVEKSFPCQGTTKTVNSNVTTISRQVYSEPGDLKKQLNVSIEVGRKVIIVRSRLVNGINWYEMENLINSLSGWMSESYILLSDKCPKAP